MSHLTQPTPPSCMGLQPLRYFSQPAFPLLYSFFKFICSTASRMPVFWLVLLQDARHAAEAEIYTSLNAKIDQFLQLADYDWLVSAQGDNTEASDYLIDLIAFLKSTFSVFTNLPVSKHAAPNTNLSLNVCHCADMCPNVFLLVSDPVKIIGFHGFYNDNDPLTKAVIHLCEKKVHVLSFHYNIRWQYRLFCLFIFFS